MEVQQGNGFLASLRIKCAEYRDKGRDIAEIYGSADTTSLEMRILREMYLEEMKNLLGDTITFKQLTSSDRNIIKHNVILRIINEGWPIPPYLTASGFAESALNHACVVAEALLLDEGGANAMELYWSYVTKNQFDRFVYMTLLREGTFLLGTRFWQQWFSPQDRQEGYKNDRVKYPKGIDDTKIYGVAKPHRYWPAQLLRKMEELRLGRISKAEREELSVGNTDVRTYTIPWLNYEDTILGARSVDDIAVGVAIKTMEILKKQGLSGEQIAKLIVAGYSPRGPLLEHGNIEEVHHIWSRIIHNVRMSSDNSVRDISPILEELLVERFSEVEREFRFERMLLKRAFVRIAGLMGKNCLV